MTTQTTCLADLLLTDEENSKRLMKEALLLTLGVATIALLSKIQIPLVPVPITGQSLGVLLVGASFGSKRAVATTLAYLAIGFAGAPVFAAAASSMTIGYLIGFVMAAYVMGRMSEMGLDRTIKNALLQFAVGHLVIFVCGVSWLTYFLGFPEAIAAGVLPFLPGMLIKTGLAAVMIPSAWRFVGRS